MLLFYMLIAYSICFGLQNKLVFLYSESYRETGEPRRFLDRLLHCTYCTGFHTGWLTWLLAWGTEGQAPAKDWAIPLSVLGWSFGAAAFCYIVDAAVRWFESNTQQPARVVEEEGVEEEDVEEEDVEEPEEGEGDA